MPFTPYATVKDVFATVVFFILFAWMIFYQPNYLGHADNYVPANPAVTPAHIVPEWYFLPFYAILRAVPDKLGGVILMFGSVLILAFAPWLDTSRVRSANYRPIYRQFFWLFLAVCVVLGWLGAKAAGRRLRHRGADLHGLLFRPLPHRHAAGRAVRDAAFPAGLDPRERDRAGHAGGWLGHAGGRRRRADHEGLRG